MHNKTVCIMHLSICLGCWFCILYYGPDSYFSRLKIRIQIINRNEFLTFNIFKMKINLSGKILSIYLHPQINDKNTCCWLILLVLLKNNNFLTIIKLTTVSFNLMYIYLVLQYSSKNLERQLTDLLFKN